MAITKYLLLLVALFLSVAFCAKTETNLRLNGGEGKEEKAGAAMRTANWGWGTPPTAVPTEMPSSSPLVVTLTWSSAGDVDLHLYEPDGTHVYYAEQQGQSGFLDVDDTTSTGPETYTVTNLMLGTYRIGLRYYSGSEPQIAHVVITTSTVVQAYDVSLSTAEAVNTTSILVADVTVTQDANGVYQFNIQSLLSSAASAGK